MTKVDHIATVRSFHGGAEHRLQLARRRLGLRVVIPADVPASHEVRCPVTSRSAAWIAGPSSSSSSAMERRATAFLFYDAAVRV